MFAAPSHSTPAEHRTGLVRCIGALCIGAASGASMTAAYYTWRLYPFEHISFENFGHSPVFFAAGFLVWFAGLTIVGAPFWFIFHNIGWRGWPAAMALGALLTFTVSLSISTKEFLVNGRLTADDWADAIHYSLLLGSAGMVVGWIVWLTAYERFRP